MFVSKCKVRLKMAQRPERCNSSIEAEQNRKLPLLFVPIALAIGSVFSRVSWEMGRYNGLLWRQKKSQPTCESGPAGSSPARLIRWLLSRLGPVLAWVARCSRAPGALQSSAGLEGQATGESLSGTEIRANGLKENSDSTHIFCQKEIRGYKATEICMRELMWYCDV